ncbi:addiction module antitoxin RelB [Bifidobacterium dolichotidis]|uniref:Addiction module antitoxin RelB n=1 Tax=Bifidobacterium dolichotidis TaxID=2306976 RepID=A0A430FTI0_9BIFI|nr:type II toxin-antitoxin system RelB/DinJ family antitoxin [Bifidobacterium dolichotidis]RSX56196.1 addiction module antitoxin RelB [Bifidobacterium dolichotidis]
MGSTVMSFRIDEKTKNEMESVCDQLGISVSSAFGIYAKKVAREKRIPFSLDLEEPISPDEKEKIVNDTLQKLLDEHSGLWEALAREDQQ